VRPRPPAGRARPSPLYIKKALASKWYYVHFMSRIAKVKVERNE
jgi:hypothetical protein